MQMSHDLPDSVLTLLDGSDLERKVGKAIILTVVDQGRPRLASLSVGEVLALDSRTILTTLYQKSRTSAALVASGTGLFVVADDGGLLKVEVEADVIANEAGRTTFHCSVVAVERDEVPYARVTRGIEYELVDHHQQVMDRWRTQVREMKELMA